MKKILFLFIGLLFFACSESEPDIYEGGSMLNFNKGTSRTEFVQLNSGSKDVEISYGAIKAVNGNHEVKLVFDAANSTAVEGTDFQILDGNDDLASGEVGGSFKLRLIEPAIGDIKTAVFKLQNSTIPFAGFDQVYTLNWKVQCFISDFLGANGSFLNTGFWVDPATQVPTTIEIDQAQPGKMFIKDFFEPGRDFVLSYDDTGSITFEPQFTGWVYNYQGTPYQVYVRMNPDPTKYSIADFCYRTMKLETIYYLNGSNLVFNGDTSENFVGF